MDSTSDLDGFDSSSFLTNACTAARSISPLPAPDKSPSVGLSPTARTTVPKSSNEILPAVWPEFVCEWAIIPRGTGTSDGESKAPWRALLAAQRRMMHCGGHGHLFHGARAVGVPKGG